MSPSLGVWAENREGSDGLAGGVVDVAGPGDLGVVPGAVTPLATADAVVGEGYPGHGVGPELPVGIHRVPAAEQPVAGHGDVVRRAEVVVGHDRGGLGVLGHIDGVVLDQDVRVAAVDLDPVIVRRTGCHEMVDVAVSHDGSA